MEELFVDLRAYEKDKKWMWFELFIRQPIGLRNLVYSIVSGFLLENHVMRTWFMVIILIVWVTLAAMTLARKKYSYPCWIALLILETVTNLMNIQISFWSVTIPEIMLVLMILYYSKRKDFFYKETCAAETGTNKRKWEIELIVIIHLIFASCMHFSLGSVSKIESMRVYENEQLAMLGWFLYGGGLCLALRWEKMKQSEWRWNILMAIEIGVVTAIVRAVLDYKLDTILLDDWDFRGIMRTSLIITGIFCLVLIRLLFAIFAKKRERLPDEARIPMIVMAVIAIFYLVEYVFSCGWVRDKEDLYYANQAVLPLYVWSMAFFLMMFWVLMRMGHARKSITEKKA